MTITKREARTLIRLLGLLQGALASSIEATIVKDTNQPRPDDLAGIAQVRLDRRNWKQAEELVKKLDHGSRP